MGERIDIDVPGAGFAAVGGWLARPAGAPRGALVVIQEIFGINAHVRDVVDTYAADGYLALAPAFFDAIERDVEMPYDHASMQRGRGMVDALGYDTPLAIVAAAATRLRNEADGVRVGAVGFCWGGTIAYLANVRLGLPAVSYYGARTVPFLDEALRAPMAFHFGERDPSIPPDAVAAHGDKHPDAAVFTYPAGHAFNRDVDPTHYEPRSAALARRRTLELFAHALQAGAPP